MSSQEKEGYYESQMATWWKPVWVTVLVAITAVVCDLITHRAYSLARIAEVITYLLIIVVVRDSRRLKRLLKETKKEGRG
jgi:uncharacterized membrane protein YkvI